MGLVFRFFLVGVPLGNHVCLAGTVTHHPHCLSQPDPHPVLQAWPPGILPLRHTEGHAQAQTHRGPSYTHTRV